MSDGTVSITDKIEFANTHAAATRAPTVALTNAAELQAALQRDQPDGDLQQSVYEWHVNKLPEDQIVPAATVREVATAFFMDILRSRQDASRRGWTDAQHRDAVLVSQPRYEQMAHTHPRMLLMLSGSDVTERKLQHLLDLIELRERLEHSSMSLAQKQAHVSRYFMSNFVRPARPGEEEEAVRNGTGLRGELVRGPAHAPASVSASVSAPALTR